MTLIHVDNVSKHFRRHTARKLIREQLRDFFQPSRMKTSMRSATLASKYTKAKALRLSGRMAPVKAHCSASSLDCAGPIRAVYKSTEESRHC